MNTESFGKQWAEFKWVGVNSNNITELRVCYRNTHVKGMTMKISRSVFQEECVCLWDYLGGLVQNVPCMCLSMPPLTPWRGFLVFPRFCGRGRLHSSYYNSRHLTYQGKNPPFSRALGFASSEGKGATETRKSFFIQHIIQLWNS